MIATPSTNGDVKAELSEQEQDQGAMEGKLIIFYSQKLSF